MGLEECYDQGRAERYLVGGEFKKTFPESKYFWGGRSTLFPENKWIMGG
jgi:hypothetical protein